MGGHNGNVGRLHAINNLMDVILQQELYELIITQRCNL